MATGIANLGVTLGLDSASFTRNMAKTERSLTSSTTRMNRALVGFQRRASKSLASMGRMAKGAFGLRGAIGLLAGSAGLGLLTKRSLATADAIAKTADAAGISTAALQEYRFAANLSGLSSEAFDKALLQLGKRMGELRTRTDSELITALKNFDAELLENIRNASSQEVALGLVFDKMGRLTDQTQRLALATAVGGRSAMLMTNMVRGGVGALEALIVQSRLSGKILSDDLTRGAEAAIDAITEFDAQIAASTIRLSVKFAPALIAAKGQLASFTTTLEETGEFWSRVFQIGFTEAQKMAVEVADLTNQARLLRKELTGRFGPSESFIGAEGDRLRDLERQIAEARAKLQPALQREIAQTRPPTTPAPTAALSATGPLVFIPSAKDLDRAREMNQVLEDARGIFEATRTPLERYNAEIARLNERLSQGVITQDTYNRAIEQAKESWRSAIAGAAGLGTALDDVDEKSRSLADAVGSFGLIFTSKFEDMIVSGGSFREILRGIESDLIRLILRLTLIEPLLKGLREGFGGSGASFGSGITSFVGTLVGSLFGGVAGAAAGADAVIAANPDIFHAGGTVGRGGTPSRGGVRASDLINAQVLHQGGPVQRLGANERFIRAEVGETVRTRGQEDEIERGLRSRRGRGGMTIHNHFGEGITNLGNEEFRQTLNHTATVQGRILSKALARGQG